jgi:hypothetical protein
MIEIILYKMNGCYYCVEFQPEWERIKEEYSDKIKFIEYEKSKNDDECEKANIQGFPTIIFDISGTKYKLTKRSDYENIVKFVLKNGNGNNDGLEKIKKTKMKGGSKKTKEGSKKPKKVKKTKSTKTKSKSKKTKKTKGHKGGSKKPKKTTKPKKTKKTKGQKGGSKKPKKPKKTTKPKKVKKSKRTKK